MNLVTAKKNEIQNAFPGIQIEVSEENGILSKVVLYDTNGNYLEFQKGSYEPLKVFKIAPPKMVERYEVKGTFRGLVVSENFETKYEADNRLKEIVDYSDDHKLEVVKVQVPEESLASSS